MQVKDKGNVQQIKHKREMFTKFFLLIFEDPLKGLLTNFKGNGDGNQLGPKVKVKRAKTPTSLFTRLFELTVTRFCTY